MLVVLLLSLILLCLLARSAHRSSEKGREMLNMTGFSFFKIKIF
jgi:hypothetical protein